LPAELGAMTSEVDPGLGFAARMTAGAQHRIVVRHRRRVAVAVVSAAAAASLLTFALMREPANSDQVAQPAADLGSQQDPEEIADESDDLKALVRIADTDRSRRFSANWRDIQKPLKPYRTLVQGVQP
jgi:hypothetical protein